MLRLLPFLPLIVCAAPMPTPGLHSPVSPAHPDEARAFAGQLVGIADEISRMYVRPVSRRELLRTALTGLYEDMGKPVPDDLDAALERAEATPPAPTPASPADGAPAPPVDVGRAALMAIVGQARCELGDPAKLRNGNDLRLSLQSMLKCLDPYCALVGADELRRAQVPEQSRYDLGLDVAEDGNLGILRIKSVVLGSPAQRAGLRPGDQITHVQGEAVDPESYAGFATLLHSLPGEAPIARDPGGQSANVLLTVRRNSDAKPREITLEFEHYEPEQVLGVRRESCGGWTYWVDEERKLAHVRIGSLDHGVTDELTQVLADLKQAGLRGLILDLRWSPGGYLIEATRLAGLFIPDGMIARTRSKNRFGQWDEQEYASHGVAAFLDFPLVVLVNGETSGGAELIAAALQDHQRAVIAGQRTLGKASIQTQEALPLENTGLKLTSGTFHRPNGKALHRFPDSRPNDDWGVRPMPEHDTPVSADLSRQLREWWLQLSLRPAEEREILPLDDPANDPQREAALRVLEGMVK
jgi:carboxyl-terminal processing protease